MPDDSVYHLNLVIDDLTNSIRQLNSGESLGYIREPKNVDLIVGPSVFAEATRQTIAQAIARYKKTGQKPVSIQITTQDASNAAMPAGGAKTVAVRPQCALKKRAKI